MSNKSLGEFQLCVLAAILRLKSNAYGAALRREIAKRTGRDVAIGQIYAALERLEKNGFISSWEGNPTKERGGRAKRFYKIEALGHKAFYDARNRLTNMWDQLDPEGEVSYE